MMSDGLGCLISSRFLCYTEINGVPVAAGSYEKNTFENVNTAACYYAKPCKNNPVVL